MRTRRFHLWGIFWRVSNVSEFLWCLIMLCTFAQQENAQTCSRCGFSINGISGRISRVCTGNASDPGTELHALLRDWLGIEPTADCPCRSMAGKMDTLGPDWCEGEGMSEILDVMRAEHAKRRADGRTILPWADAGARQLVLLACRRARAKAAG